jgi:hypothetical protein
MVVIKAKINQFNYFLRFDDQEEGWAEGLIQNATKMNQDEAEAVVKHLESVWPLSIIAADPHKPTQ